jgi:peptidylprolyl isomerase
MKKSEKVKGREAVAAQKKLYTRLAIIVAAVIIITVVGYFLLNPSGAKSGDTVSVVYTGTLDDGTVFDSNVNGTPLTFVIGQGRVIKGFEEAVTGMAPGETRMVRIPFDKAYGPYKGELVHVVNRSTLPADMVPILGEHYSIRRTTDGAVAVVKILNITPSTVTWDENHDLAGKDLAFSITLIENLKK